LPERKATTYEPAVYVDAMGTKRAAQAVGKPDEQGRTLLVISRGGLNFQRARYSERGEPSTWHRPPKAS
jgi:hypothetical protein